jgi:hypothetical protein
MKKLRDINVVSLSDYIDILSQFDVHATKSGPAKFGREPLEEPHEPKPENNRHFFLE